MGALTWRSRAAVTIGVALTLVLAVLIVTPGESRAQVSMHVDLASDAGPSTGVGLGFLYGVTGDGTQPSDALLEPLKMNSFRAGGHMTRGWIEDGYRYGPATQTIVDSIIDQAERFTAEPYGAQYQAILSDMYGAYGGQPANTMYPCDNNDCSNRNANGTITNAASGLCLDVSGAGTANGTPVHLWTCNGGSNQQWTLR